MHFQNALLGKTAKGNEKEDTSKSGLRLTCTYLGCSLLGTLFLYLCLQLYFACFLHRRFLKMKGLQSLLSINCK